MLPLSTELSAGPTGQKEPFRLIKIGDQEYEVFINGEQPAFSIRRLALGSWEQYQGEPAPSGVIEELGENLDDIDQQEFEFDLEHEGAVAKCRVAMGESGFGVLYNDQLVAEINTDDEGSGWEVTSGGPIDPTELQLIGEKITRHYS
jgi:hypothetical protein